MRRQSAHFLRMQHRPRKIKLSSAPDIYTVFGACGSTILSFLSSPYEYSVACTLLGEQEQQRDVVTNRIVEVIVIMNRPLLYKSAFKTIRRNAGLIYSAFGIFRPHLEFYMRYLLTTCTRRTRTFRDRYTLFLFQRYAHLLLLPSLAQNSVYLRIWCRICINILDRTTRMKDDEMKQAYMRTQVITILGFASRYVPSFLDKWEKALSRALKANKVHTRRLKRLFFECVRIEVENMKDVACDCIETVE